MLRQLESVFQDEKNFFLKNFFWNFFKNFFQNIFHFSMKTRTQQKILWSIFELFWSEMMPYSYWQSWMHSMFPLFCTIFRFWNYKITVPKIRGPHFIWYSRYIDDSFQKFLNRKIDVFIRKSSDRIITTAPDYEGLIKQ